MVDAYGNELNINVIVTGLDGDFQRKPMGEILDLLPIANTITKLSDKEISDICIKYNIINRNDLNKCTRE